VKYRVLRKGERNGFVGRLRNCLQSAEHWNRVCNIRY